MILYPIGQCFTWVCFRCRTTTRRQAKEVSEVRCRTCSEPCECLGHKLRAPPQNKLKKWQALRKYFYWLKIKHKVILWRRLEGKPKNKEQSLLIKQLEKELREEICKDLFK